MTDYVPVLLSSAAIGALVSSAMTLYGQTVERRARRREMLLAESVKLAIDHRAGLIAVATAQRQGEAFIPEGVRLVQTYYVGLSALITEGRLPIGMFASASAEAKREFQERFNKG
jgi:hypothetical protein